MLALREVRYWVDLFARFERRGHDVQMPADPNPFPRFLLFWWWP